MTEKLMVTEKAYAKINLHLDITGRMEKGYHRVETVMQTVSLCDILTISCHPEAEFRIVCDHPDVPTDDTNLVVKAAKAFFHAIRKEGGAEIAIQKRIPMAAGMAGGSADAAAVLRGMNRLFGFPLQTDALCEVGSAIGADVPFCIVGGTWYADGKGDCLHEFLPLPDCVILVACGGEGVSTPWAYRLLDEKYGGFEDPSLYVPQGVTKLEEAMKTRSIPKIATCLYNVFESPVLACRPVADEIRREMLSGGATAAMMSGSGPSVFGIFEDLKEAEYVSGKLREKGIFTHISTPVPHFGKINSDSATNMENRDFN